MHFGMVICCVPFLSHCDLDILSFYNTRVRGISFILFEVGIPNLVCGFILEWQSGAYILGHFYIDF